MNEAAPHKTFEIGIKARAIALVAVAAALSLLLFSPQAHATKYVSGVIGGASGSAQAQFNNPRGMAFNDPAIADGSLDPKGASTNGYLYVADAGNNRIQVFDANKNFKFAFGRGVQTGADGAEVCDHTEVPCTSTAADDEQGEFSNPYDVDINQQTGDVYVADGANRRVQQFKADGTFVRAWGWGVDSGAAAFQVCDAPADLPCQAGIGGGEGGQFGAGSPTEPSPISIAVDPAAPHHVFVGDAQNRRLQEFAADGSFVRLWGWDVVPTGQPGDRGEGNVSVAASSFEICSSTTVGHCKAAASGESGGIEPNNKPRDGAFRPGQPTDIVIDGPSGVVYTPLQGGFAATAGPRILRFDSDGTDAESVLMPHLVASYINPQYMAFLDGVLIPEFQGAGQVEALALRPLTGNLLVGRAAGYLGKDVPSRVQELDTSVEPPEHVEDFAANSGLELKGLAVNPTNDDFYLTSTTGGFHRIYIADENGAPPPVVSLNTPVVNGLDASFSGTVTPGGPAGFNVTYNFQYSKDGVNWTSVPATDNPLGDGVAPVPVTDEVQDLDPNTTYKVRLLTRKAFGNPDVASTNQVEFTTVAIAPEAKTVAPAVRRVTSARLAARINPNNSPTDYYFEWGIDTSYGNRVPIPDGQVNGLGERGAFAEISGLQPNTTYHYKVTADNGVGGPVEGTDISFTTRSVMPAPVGERGYEMVTPPFKVVRAAGSPSLPPGNNPNPSVPSLDGDKVSWSIQLFPLTDDVKHPYTGDKRLVRRTAEGWVNSTRNTLPILSDPDTVGSPGNWTKFSIGGSSGDMETVTFRIYDGLATQSGLLPTEGKYANRLYTRRDGTGTSGFTPWLTNPEQQISDVGFAPMDLTQAKDQAILNDEGSAVARWGWYRGLAGAGDPSDNQQLSGKNGGSTAYLQRAATADGMPTAPKELINECTGTTAGGDATQIPRRQGAGVENDTISSQACQAGSVTSRRGATVGASSNPNFLLRAQSFNSGTAATALSDDGNRVYFQAPDFEANEVPTSTCTAVTGANSDCVPQLYVRSHKADDSAIVRWVSRSRSVATGSDNGYTGAMISGQRVGLMGAGVAFQGASRDGSIVYFKTDAPLTPDDPNGTGTPGPKTTGTASSNSWDLYRFELPADPDADPDTGVLTRISGGPSGTADPSTNVTGVDGPLRFHSDDGKRAYFLTTSPIAGANNTPPTGSDTTPGGTVGNTTVRNLYLFDDDETGADRYRFIARLPYYDPSTNQSADTPGALNSCASSSPQIADHLAAQQQYAIPLSGNCFRGTPDGGTVAFATAGQLTDSDADDAADVYLYDAEADELARVSAPPQGAFPYGCNVDFTVSAETYPVTGYCNAELGRDTGISQAGKHRVGFSAPIGSWELSRGWAGMRYYNLATDKDGVVSLFFASKVPLIPEDVNSHMDVYEWRAGELSLISPGDSPDNAFFSGNSLDGEDVFFQTSQRIDPREIDVADLDVYDARVGGGFPPPVALTPCDVLAFRCEVEATPAPRTGSSATTGFTGSGNVAKKPPKGCAKGKVKRKGRCVKKQSAKSKKRGKAGAEQKGGRR